MGLRHWLICLPLLASVGAQAQEPADGLLAVGDTCTDDCRDRHAIVFVHGITGSASATFKNGNFDWPTNFPRTIAGEVVDVFTLQYRSAILSWLADNNPNFDELVDYAFDKLKVIRQKRYRSIGFIAHSLGGIVVASYLHELKAMLGHPHRSENSFLITLGTPRSGSYFTNFVAPFASILGATNPLLDVLRKDNLYLRMSDRLGTWTQLKTTRFGCRPSLVYVAYEKNALIAPMSIESMRRAPPRDAQEFELTHEMIAKPVSLDDPIHKFTQDSIADAFEMVGRFSQSSDALCSRIPYIDEGDLSPPLTRPLPPSNLNYFLAPKRELKVLQTSH